MLLAAIDSEGNISQTMAAFMISDALVNLLCTNMIFSSNSLSYIAPLTKIQLMITICTANECGD